MLNTFFFEFFFKNNDGIILFLPHEIIKSTSSHSIFLKTESDIGVNFGGITFQKPFVSTVW